jgi:DMSO/TMAO reductase YedYZ molybdopterin-dependent catalytic subunit
MLLYQAIQSVKGGSMRKQSNFLAILLIAVVLISGVTLSGCTTGSMNVSPTPAPTENPTAAPTAEPTVTVTATPTITATATPTATPTASQVYSVPPWVDYSNGNVTTVPTVMTTFTSIAPNGTYPYDGNIPPWVDYKIKVPEPVVVSVTGNVANPLYLTLSDLHEYPIQHVHVSYTKNGVTTVIDCNGASLSAILNAAKPKSSASTVKFIGADGYSPSPKYPELKLTDIAADSGAVIAFTDQGLRIIIPSQITGYWVSNIASIQVK